MAPTGASKVAPSRVLTRPLSCGFGLPPKGRLVTPPAEGHRSRVRRCGLSVGVCPRFTRSAAM